MMTAPRDPANWPERTFHAMGCQMSARLAVEPHLAATPLAQVETFFHAAESALSRFQPESELTFVNTHPDKWLSLSPLLWDVLSVALEMAEQTGGLFDPTLLCALESAGYRRSFEQMTASTDDTTPAEDASQSHCTRWRGGGYHRLRRRHARRELLLPAGWKLDLGGIAKGYIAQAAVNHLRPWGAALVDAGGDLVAGNAPPGHPGWPVAVAAPSPLAQGSSMDVAQLWLVNEALATSGIDYRHWQVQGRTRHHIIDPRTGEPAANDLLSASVLAPTAAQAEGWAKAAIILGAAHAAGELQRRSLAALLVRRDGEILRTPLAQHWETGQDTQEQHTSSTVD
jgi:thiamine biosynthesis lipoprotein